MNRRLLVNAAMSVVQVVVNGGVLFVLYRFLLDTIGIDDFGVWAIVLSTTSLGSIADLGLAASATKFVAMHLARDDREHVVRIVQTAAISVGVFLAVTLVALYVPLQKLLGLIIEPEAKVPAALSILPYALLSFWLNAMAGVVQSSIDGHQRIYLRNILVMVVAIAYLFLCFSLVPSRGLIGLAQAQVLQALLLLASSWVVLRFLLPALPLAPLHWSRPAFREMLGYSLRFQGISVTKMFYEPTTKALLSKFGGVDMAGFYEMAYRLAIYLRSIIATAHQAIVPTIADLHEKDRDLIQDLYRKSYRFVLFIILSSLPLLVSLVPAVSRLWIGSYEQVFVTFAMLLLVAWFLNMVANPAYYAYMGIGDLKWNLNGHVVIAVVNAVLGFALGATIGGLGVVIGFVVAIITGSLLISIAYQREYKIRITELVEARSILLGVASLVGMFLALSVSERLGTSGNLFVLFAAVLGAYAFVVSIPIWMHPARRQVTSWLGNLRGKSRPRTEDPFVR